MWTIPVFSACTGLAGAFPGKGPVLGAARQRNPQHFHRVRTGSVPLRTSHPHVCAQPAGKQSSCRAGRQSADQRASACVTQPARRTRGPGPGPDQIVQEPGPRMLAAAWAGGRGRLRRLLPPVAARPRGDLACAPGRDLGHRGWHSGGCRRAGPGSKTFLPGRIRQGPSMYEMEGPCPASPRQVRPVAWPCWRRAPPPVPGTRARDRSPGSSHVPGVAPKVVPVSNGESISTASANAAQEPEANYFRFLRYPHGIHRKNAVIRA